MSSTELVAKTTANIKQALCDYREHTSMTSVLDDVSDSFIERLARDSVRAKHDLRELLSKSPIWSEELQALVINGTRTHDPDFTRVHRLMYNILEPFFRNCDGATADALYRAMRFFDSPDLDPADSIAAIKALAPRAYRANRKKSRIFKAICDALGITDESKGSYFQKGFAMFADELNGRRIDFKLYLSINPCHFLTMSNPKCDSRGNMLTSCHSFNSTEYPYNCGCTGYARDEVTMIAFTVDNPENLETFNNRKTSRQLFMYKVGNGLLLQSRMYNTSGGTYGAQKESALYRDLVQRELSELEGVPNLWKTYTYFNNDICTIYPGAGFGGYQDWIYSEFDAKISIRQDHADDFKAFEVGTYGLCICCGKEIERGLYCRNCDSEYSEVCDDCGEHCSETYSVRDSCGNIRHVCWDCREDNYRQCIDCEEYYPMDDMTLVDDEWVCSGCLDEYYNFCDECECYYRDDLHRAYNRLGYEVYICDDCCDADYGECEECGELHHTANLYTVRDRNSFELTVCENCRKNYYAVCDECGMFYPKAIMIDGLCPDCASKK